jgi:hypothetical protein
VQCMASAMTAVGAASGTRAFLVSRRFSWVTPRRLRVVTIVLMAAALIASATLVSGSGPGSGQQQVGKTLAAERR